MRSGFGFTAKELNLLNLVKIEINPYWADRGFLRYRLLLGEGKPAGALKRTDLKIYKKIRIVTFAATGTLLPPLPAEGRIVFKHFFALLYSGMANRVRDEFFLDLGKKTLASHRAKARKNRGPFEGRINGKLYKPGGRLIW
jgi:hypothetical protein